MPKRSKCRAVGSGRPGEYEQILKHNPRLPGIHFRIGRLLLSKPDPGPSVPDEARKEFEEELKIDPSNAGQSMCSESCKPDPAMG